MFMRSGYSQPTVNVFLATCLHLPVGPGPTTPDELGPEIEHRCVSAEQVRGLAFGRSLDQGVEGSRGIGLGWRSLHARVFEPDCEVVGPVAGGHQHLGPAPQALEIHIPAPGGLCAIGPAVVQADQEVAAAREVDRGAEGLVETGRGLWTG